MSFKDKKIIVGITGGIAAYKIPSLVRLFKKESAEVRVVMTANASKFVTTLTLETLSQNPVAVEMFPDNRFVGTHHIDLAEWPDFLVIAPATANFIAKIHSGICDDLLSTVICATRKPIFIAPAMNDNMYLNPITQRNIKHLASLGYRFIEPNEGELACNSLGKGRMAEPEEIFASIIQYLQKKKSLSGKRVLVTAGPCREALDPVRFISNRSSGKMGHALAKAAYERGAEVVLISGPSSLSAEPGIAVKKVETTMEMFQAAKKEFSRCDIIIMAAAPADFTVSNPFGKKIKKGKSSITIELTPTIDILQELKGLKKKNQKVIGFALETENGAANAKKKMIAKGLDLIALNMIGKNMPFESDRNRLTLIYRNGKLERLPSMDKSALAEKLIDRIILLR
jgi:phosphopantothenoylcysteine decarboxylase/phosphopantothenate--cysteine ligase